MLHFKKEKSWKYQE